MKKIVLLLCFVFVHLAYSQKEANIWYFGENAGLDFSAGEPIAITDGQLNTKEGCASIADENGSLLFYTDGNKVYNKNHVLMSNGSGLHGNSSSTQSAIVVPKPNSNSKYYCLFEYNHLEHISKSTERQNPDISESTGRLHLVWHHKNDDGTYDIRYQKLCP